MSARWLAVVLVVLAGGPAAAAEPATDALARALTLFDEGDYERAARDFEAAFVASKDPAIQFNIGQCYRFLGDPKPRLCRIWAHAEWSKAT